MSTLISIESALPSIGKIDSNTSDITGIFLKKVTAINKILQYLVSVLERWSWEFGVFRRSRNKNKKRLSGARDLGALLEGARAGEK